MRVPLASGGDESAASLADEFAEGELEPAEVEVRALKIDLSQHAQRLDRAIAEKIPEFSRSYLQQLLSLGAVSLNGLLATKSAQRIKAGDTVRVEMRPTLQSQAFRPESMCIDVVHEDENLLVINKSAGLVVHPAPGNWTGTLLNGLLARDARASEVPRAGIVHRLDKDTSGLMVVARNRNTMDALVRMIAARQVSRQYLALAHGTWRGMKMRTLHGQNRYRMSGGYGGRVLGALHFAYRQDASDTGTHGLRRTPIGGGYALWRHCNCRNGAPGTARISPRIRASPDRAAHGVSSTAAA